MNHAIRGSLFRILRVTVLVLVLIAAATWLRNILTSLESEQAVINAEIIEIRTPITGVLEINDVRPGMLLEKGKPLFRVENPRFGDRETVAQFNTLQTLVESLRAELASARRELEVAGVEQERARRLYKAQVIARVEKELAETRCVTLRQLVDVKTQQLARTAKRAQEMEAQMTLQKASVVTMPTDGLIWSITGKSGEQANSNTLVMEVINPSRIWVDAFFAERHAKELKPGLPAIDSLARQHRVVARALTVHPCGRGKNGLRHHGGYPAARDGKAPDRRSGRSRLGATLRPSRIFWSRAQCPGEVREGKWATDSWRRPH